MGEHHWKFLLHAINAIDEKVTKCLWTDWNSKGVKKKKKIISPIGAHRTM
jgi:hypothetical protein